MEHRTGVTWQVKPEQSGVGQEALVGVRLHTVFSHVLAHVAPSNTLGSGAHNPL